MELRFLVSSPIISGLKTSIRNIAKVKIAKNKKRFATACPFGQFVVEKYIPIQVRSQEEKNLVYP